MQYHSAISVNGSGKMQIPNYAIYSRQVRLVSGNIKMTF
jgi:hypothetical protein